MQHPKYKQLLSVIFLLVLLFVFAIPVSAAGDSWRTYSKSLSSFGDVDNLYWSDRSSDYFASTAPGSLRFNTHNSSFSSLCLKLSLSDPVSVQPGESVRVSYSGSGYSHSSITYVTIHLVDTGNYLTSPLVSTIYAVYPVTQASGGSFTFSIDYLYTADASYNFDRIYLDFTVTNKVAGGYFQLNDEHISIGYGNASDPNAPAFASPNNSGIDQYQSYEDDVNNKISGGLKNAGNLMDGLPSDLTNFASGLMFFSSIYTRLISNVPELNTVLNISLALGIFALLVGLAVPAIRHASRSDSQRSSSSDSDDD